jgi:hypothetical protein
VVSNSAKGVINNAFAVCINRYRLLRSHHTDIYCFLHGIKVTVLRTPHITFPNIFRNFQASRDSIYSKLTLPAQTGFHFISYALFTLVTTNHAEREL